MDRRTVIKALAATPLAYWLTNLHVGEEASAATTPVAGSFHGHGAVYDENLKLPPVQLHIWHADYEEFVIAKDAEDAAKVYRETIGCTGKCHSRRGFREDGTACCEDVFSPDWTMWSDDKPFTRWDEELKVADVNQPTEEDRHLGWQEVTVKHYPGVGIGKDYYLISLKALPAWWCAREGRGYLASANA